MSAISAKDSDLGRHYLSETGISIRVWRKYPNSGSVNKVLIYIPEISKLIDVPPDYQLKPNGGKEKDLDEKELKIFDTTMLQQSAQDVPGLVWSQTGENGSTGETMTETAAGTPSQTASSQTDSPKTDSPKPAEPSKSKKDVRAELNTRIAELKTQRKALSDANIETKKQLKEVKDKTERKTLTDKVKENVKSRAQMSDDIKNIIQKIKDLRVNPTL